VIGQQMDSSVGTHGWDTGRPKLLGEEKTLVDQALSNLDGVHRGTGAR